MILISEIEKDETPGSIYEYSREAKSFLEEKKWCNKIITGWYELGIEGILAIFRFVISPINDSVDNELWVIVGDLPPAYLVLDNAPSALSALSVYVDEMKLWVDAVKNNSSLDGIIPVNVPPELQYAEMLEGRLLFIKDTIIPEFIESFKESSDNT